MTLIECRTLYNARKLVPQDSLIQRPSVYGLIVRQGQALLVRTQHTDKVALPGGGIEKGESIGEALQREMREEAGIEIEVGAFAHFHTDLFYYDPLDMAFHGFLFYYYCRPLTFELVAQADDDDAGAPGWYDLDALSAESFQAHGALVLRLLRAAKNES